MGSVGDGTGSSCAAAAGLELGGGISIRESDFVSPVESYPEDAVLPERLPHRSWNPGPEVATHLLCRIPAGKEGRLARTALGTALDTEGRIETADDGLVGDKTIWIYRLVGE
jgi:hypothetical protein